MGGDNDSVHHKNVHIVTRRGYFGDVHVYVNSLVIRASVRPENVVQARERSVQPKTLDVFAKSPSHTHLRARGIVHIAEYEFDSVWVAAHPQITGFTVHVDVVTDRSHSNILGKKCTVVCRV